MTMSRRNPQLTTQQSKSLNWSNYYWNLKPIEQTREYNLHWKAAAITQTTAPKKRPCKKKPSNSSLKGILELVRTFFGSSCVGAPNAVREPDSLCHQWWLGRVIHFKQRLQTSQELARLLGNAGLDLVRVVHGKWQSLDLDCWVVHGKWQSLDNDCCYAFWNRRVFLSSWRGVYDVVLVFKVLKDVNVANHESYHCAL